MAEGAKVKVAKSNSGSYAVLTVIPDSTSVEPLSSCVSAEYLKSYYSGSVAAYEAAEAKKAVCMAGYMAATVLTEKIDDIRAGLSEINLRLASLQKTRAYLKNFSAENLNGLRLAAIPAGADELKQYKKAAPIAMQCLKDSASGVTERSTAVGDLTSETQNIFNPIPAIAIQKLEETRAINTRIKLLLDKIDIGISAGLVVTKHGKEQMALVGSALSLLLKNQEIAAAHAIPITVDDLSENYQALRSSGYYTSMSMKWVPGLLSKRKTNKMTALRDELLQIVKQYVPPDKLPGLITHMSIQLDGMAATGWLSENDLYNELQKSVSNGIMRYQQLKIAHGAALKKMQDELNALVSAGYNCH